MTMIAALIFAAALGGLWLLSAKIIGATVRALADPEGKIHARLRAPADPAIRQPMREVETWAEEHEYKDDLMFDFDVMDAGRLLFCRTWKNTRKCTYLVFYSGMGRHFTELVTIYDDNTSVTTTNAAEAHTLPVPPGAFVQSFPGNGLNRIHDLHGEGCRTLERRTGLEPRESAGGTADLVIRALTRQGRYIQSIPGWRWKGLWWMVTRKQRMTGKDVAWQLDQFGVHEPGPAPTDRLQ